MKIVAALLFALVALGSVVAGAENAAELESKGVAELKRSLAESDQIIPAALHFGKAAAVYDKANNAAKLAEMNAYLFWCKKMSAEQMETFQKNKDPLVPDISKRMDSLEADAPPADDAKKYFDRASAYATAHAAEHLLIAVQFYEVAELFGATDFGTQAQERRAKEMRIAMGGESATDTKETIAKLRPKTTALTPDEARLQTDFKKTYNNKDPQARKSAVSLLAGTYHPSSWQLVAGVASADPDPSVRTSAFETLAKEPAHTNALAHIMTQCFASVRAADMEVKMSFARAMAASEFKLEPATTLANMLASMPYPERSLTEKPGGPRDAFEQMLTAFKGLTECDVWVETPGAPKRVKDWWTANQSKFVQADKDLAEKYKKADAEAAK